VIFDESIISLKAIAETKVEEPVAEVVQENLEKTEERLEEVWISRDNKFSQ